MSMKLEMSPNQEVTPFIEYKEYSKEHAVPIKESWYALFDRYLGTRGNMASTVTMNT